jgi:hypothetical protein
MLQEFAGRILARRHLARLLRPGIMMSLVLASGCGSSDAWNRQAVSGYVSLDGQPLPDGAILLEPRSSSEAGMAVGATIRRGSFAIVRDQGPPPGSYRVRIYSSSGVQAPPAPGQTDRTRRPMVERVPEDYNTRSDLQADVTPGGANRFTFELQAGTGG